MCIYWMVHSSILNVVWYISYAVYIFWLGIPDSVTAIVQQNFVLAYKMYCLWVVVAFIDEVKALGGYNDALRGLTDEEVEEFIKGRQIPGGIDSSLANPSYKPYNSNYEIPSENIDIGNVSHLNTTPFSLGLHIVGSLYAVTQTSKRSLEVGHTERFVLGHTCGLLPVILKKFLLR